jgi:GT2 family glycosyltransferase/glycosyltransferase involved in cell wall biosynthesis
VLFLRSLSPPKQFTALPTPVFISPGIVYTTQPVGRELAQITVVIPVYGAFEDAARCLQSVIHHSPPAIQILVIDDASPNGVAEHALGAISDSRLRYVRNAENLGFAASANRAFFELAPDGDVILLNSDTEVGPSWVENLHAAAYSRPRVGTVSSLTNNGTICSVPRICVDNVWPPGELGIDAVAIAVSNTAARIYPVLPTSVGHCMYLPREALAASGGFDAKLFGRGYGEENDLSLRLQQLGFVDLLDDATFIFHRGSASFGSDKTVQQEINAPKVEARHPGYEARVAQYVGENPLHPIQERLWNFFVDYWGRKRKYSVLHVLHNGPETPVHHPLGGTEVHVRELIQGIPQAAHWSLVPRVDRYVLTAHLGWEQRTFEIPRAPTRLKHFVTREFFDLIHIHHTKGFDPEDVREAVEIHGNFLVSLHDPHLFCQQSMMVTPDGRPCRMHECVSVCGYTPEATARGREVAKQLLRVARSVVMFSHVTEELVTEVIGRLDNTVVIPHGSSRRFQMALPTGKRQPPQRPTREHGWRILLLGGFARHKGLDLINALASSGPLPECSVELHLIGRVPADAAVRSSLIDHGPYEPGDLPGKIAACKPHIALLPSLSPETYGLAVDEALACGIPVIVTALGAPAERVTRTEAGWILSTAAGPAALNDLRRLLSDLTRQWSSYLSTWEKAQRFQAPSLATELEATGQLYDRWVAGSGGYDPSRVVAYLQPDLVFR